jgi:hypothetical protein
MIVKRVEAKGLRHLCMSQNQYSCIVVVIVWLLWIDTWDLRSKDVPSMAPQPIVVIRDRHSLTWQETCNVWDGLEKDSRAWRYSFPPVEGLGSLSGPRVSTFDRIRTNAHEDSLENLFCNKVGQRAE